MADLAVRAAYWRMTVCRGGCVMCRHFPPAEVPEARRPDLRTLHAHHIISKEFLKREGYGGDWRVLYDERNGICLCEYHHWRHEHAVEWVPRAVLPEHVWDFAYTLDFQLEREMCAGLLDREYP